VREATEDLYVVLGVARAANAGELRRAYRRLALAHHPDRAGAASAATFARIADAYRVLSNPVARAAYDAHLADRAAWHARGEQPIQTGGVAWTVSTTGWSAARARAVRDAVPRLSGALDDLVASGIARVLGDGALELDVTPDEARAGGTAVIKLPLKVPCPTCGGVARPRDVWCRRCEFEGRVVEHIPVPVRIPPSARHGMSFAAPVGRGGVQPLRVRLRVSP